MLGNNANRLKRILILDDEEPIRRSLAAFFTDIGYDAYPLATPPGALELLAVQSLDVAVVDLEMPEMNGIEFIIKAQVLQPSLKYVVYTGSLNHSLLKELEGLGIPHNLVLEKPLTSIGDMLEAVQQAYYE